MRSRFWSSVDLTGNQTVDQLRAVDLQFWSSVDLTGNQTEFATEDMVELFWSSVDLTGNQTPTSRTRAARFESLPAMRAAPLTASLKSWQMKWGSLSTRRPLRYTSKKTARSHCCETMRNMLNS